LVARRGWTIDFDGLFIYNDVAKKVLLNHFSDQSPAAITAIVTMPDTATYTGECILTSMDFTGPYEDALTISGTLQGTGELTVSVS
jgi:predicted secreted protein